MKISKKILAISIGSVLSAFSPLMQADVFAYTYSNETLTSKKLKEDTNGLNITNNSDIHVTGDLDPNTGYRSGNPVSYNCVTYHIGPFGIRNLPDGIDASVASEIIQSLKDGNWNQINKDYPGLNVHVTNLKYAGRGQSNPFWEGNDISVAAANKYNYENLSAAQQAELDEFLKIVNSNDDLAYVNGRWVTKGKCGAEVFTNWKDFVGGEDVYTITNPIWNDTGDADITVDSSRVIVDGNSNTDKNVVIQNGSYVSIGENANYGTLSVDDSDLVVGNNLTVNSNGLTGTGGASISVANMLTLTDGPLNMEEGSILNVGVLKAESPNGETSIIGSDTEIKGNLTVMGKVSGVEAATEDNEATNYGQVKELLDEAEKKTDNKLSGKADTDMSNLSQDGKETIKNLAKDSIKVIAGNNTTVTTGEDSEGHTTYAVNVSDETIRNILKDDLDAKADKSDLEKVKDEMKNFAAKSDMEKGLSTKADKDYVDQELEKKADRDLSNITDAGKDVIRDAVKDDLALKANVDASNVDAETWGQVIATGNVEAGDVRAVSGDTLYKALKDSNDTITDILNDKANKNLDNLTDEGKGVIRETVKGDLDKKADTSYVNEQLASKADKEYVEIELNTKADKEYVDEELLKKANIDASNIEGYEKNWADKLGVGKVESGNSYLVTGDTVYNSVNEIVEKNSLVKSDGKTVTVAPNDNATKVDFSGSNGNRVLTGITTDPMDSSSAANVGYVNDVASGLYGQVDSRLSDLQSSLTGEINKTGAQSAAMANLSYLPYEEGEGKYNFAVGVGNYGNSTSTALGMKYYANRNFSWNISTTLGNSKNMFGGGISMRFGPSTKKHILENTADKAKIADLEKQVAMLNVTVNKLVNSMDVLHFDESKRNSFPDIPENHWAKEAVDVLHGNGDIQGYPDGKFHGNRRLSRYEYAQILYRMLKSGKEVPATEVQHYASELKQIERQQAIPSATASNIMQVLDDLIETSEI